MTDNEETWRNLSEDARHALTHRATTPMSDIVRHELMRTGLLIGSEWNDRGEPDQYSLHKGFAEWVDEHHPAE